jgi:hypothetical protein
MNFQAPQKPVAKRLVSTVGQNTLDLSGLQAR